MPITKKDFAALQPGVNELQQAALQKYLQQKQPEIAGQTEAATLGEDVKALQTPDARELIHQGGSVQAGKMHFGADPTLKATNSMAAERLRQQKMENLSKRYENLNDFSSAIQDVEKLSDTGKGGIMSNPDAQLPGTGQIASAIPDSAMGLAEMLHAVPKGTSEMRKSLSRLQLGYARALGGARGVNPMMIAKEKEAMGYIASGDPELVKKGVLSLAANVKNHYNTIRSGYTPDVVNAVHENLGGDPMAAFGRMPSTGPAGKTIGNPPTQTFDPDAFLKGP